MERLLQIEAAAKTKNVEVLPPPLVIVKEEKVSKPKRNRSRSQSKNNSPKRSPINKASKSTKAKSKRGKASSNLTQEVEQEEDNT